MFEDFGPGDLITEIEATQLQESTLMARRLAAIAELLGHRIAEAEDIDPDPGYMMITGFARTTAEVSAAMNMSPMGADHLVAQAEALDTRLLNVAALLAEGKTDWRTVQLIITRTELVRADLIANHPSDPLRLKRGSWWPARRSASPAGLDRESAEVAKV